MFKTTSSIDRMLVNQDDLKTKFCKKFNFNIYKYIPYFSFIISKKEVGDWNTKLITQWGLDSPISGTVLDYPISTIPLPPGYSGLLSSKPEQVTKISWRDVTGQNKLTFISSIYFSIIKQRSVLSHHRVSYCINVPANLTTAFMRHYISLSRKEGRSSLLVKEVLNVRRERRQFLKIFLTKK